MADDTDEISFSEWPDPPGSHPWLPAYGFQPPQDHALEKEDFLDPADAALFLGSGCGGSGSGMAHFLETIVEETSEDLCSDGGSERPPCWLDDSDADSVIHVPQGKDECDSGSERDFLCPAKRRRPNQLRPECPPSPTDTLSLSLSLSRSSSLAQFESLEQSCQLTDVSGPPSPISILSLDSLERLKGMQPTEISPDSLENSSDSEQNSSSSQGSAYRLGSNRFNNGSVSESHFNDRSLPEERFCDETYIVQNGVKENLGETNRSFFDCNEETRYWTANVDRTNEGSSSSEFSDSRSSDSDRTIHEQTVRAAEPRDPPLKYNFKSCRSLDALPSLENLDATKIDSGTFACPPRRKTSAPQYSVENLSEDSGYSDHFCNFLRMKSKSIPNVSKKNPAAAPCNKHSLKRKSDDDLPSLLVAKCQRKSEVGAQFGARGEFRPKVASPDVASSRRRETAAAGGATVGTQITAGVFRSRRPEPSSSLPDLSAASRSDAADHFDPKNARNTLPRATADRFARLLDEELNRDDGNLYSVSSVPKDLNLCDDPISAGCAPSSLDENWSFGSERAVSVAAKNFDLCDFEYPKRTNRAVIQEASFKQSFRVCDSFTTSVADLTVLDYRSEADGNTKNVLKKFTARTSKMARNLPPTRERSAESDSTTESEKIFLGEMQKTMRELSEQSKKILEKSLDSGNFDKNLSILTNKRLHSAFNPFDDVIAELEKKQARSKPLNTKPPQQPAPPAYEFNYYGDDADPPYYRRHFELSNSNTETSSPDVSEAFGGDLFYHSTPVKGGDKVQSTPNLNTFNQDDEDLYSKGTPQDDMRSSMQHVPLKNEFKPVGILGSKSQGLSGSGSSKGVHFCPVVAEVSWRERSYSEDSTGEASSTSSAYSGVSDADRTGVFATAAPPPLPTLPPPLAAPRITLQTSSTPPALQHHQPQQKQQYPQQRPQAAPRSKGEGAHSTATPASPPGRSHTSTAGASAQIPNQNFPMERQKTPPRSRIGGFLSRFANFRFSTRRSSAKKKQDHVNKDSNNDPTPVKNDKLAPQTPQLPDEPTPISNGNKLKVVHQEKVVLPDKECPEYIYIPLKGKTAEGRPPLPPGRAPRSPLRVEGLLETDLDTETTRTVLVSSSRARSLLALPPPPPVPRSHKSMEYLLDKENLKCVEPPENDLQKNSADRVLSEHQLRVQRSLQKLNLPDWYKNSPVPREGFLLKKRASDAGSNSGRGWQQQQAGLGGKTTSLGSLGGGIPTRQLALTPPSHYQQPGFTRWSTSRLNSAQTSPCSSARSSVRCGAVSPLNSPARPPRVPRPTRPPYLGWRSQERLASPRTPHERLAVSLLPASPPVPANTTEEIQTSIKEVTSAIVHYVSGLEPGKEARPSSPRGSPRLCWVESSFVGTKPLESPQTPVVVAQLSPPHEQQTNHNSASERNGHANHALQNNNSHYNNLHQQQQQRPLQLELHPTATLAATTYQHEWQTSQHSLLNLAVSKPSPGSTTLEDVLDSLLGLPPAAPRVPSPQTSPRRSTSPYYILGLQSRYNERSNSQTSSLQFSLSSKTDDRSTEYRTASRISGDTFDSLEPSQQDGDQQHHGRRRSSAESSSCSTLAPGMDGADKEDNSSLISLPKIRLRAKSAAAGKHSSRRQSEPVASQKSVSLDRRVSYDSHISRGDLNLSRTSLSDLQQSKASLKSITSINTDASGDDPLVHCRYTKCTSATNHTDARRNYKNCHNCNYMYCSRECRRAHWEKHRKVCLHSRASALCRQILSTAKEDKDSLHHISTIAQKGYLSNGRGVVKVFFTSPDSAEKFTTNGFQSLGEPAYITWPDLAPNEMGPELYAELIKLCKSYNPETRLVLYVAVCIISEVPTKGAVVKWERQLVSRCAKLRLSKTVMGKIPHGQLPFHLSPKAKVRSKDKHHKDKEVIYKAENIETLILTSNSANFHRGSDVSVQKIRELSFHNIQMQLHRRGVNLKRHFPEVYSKLCAYVEGVCDKFTPMTVYPRDNLTGKSFMCVIMPETEPDKFHTLPTDSLECHTIDVSIDHSDQVSTPM